MINFSFKTFLTCVYNPLAAFVLILDLGPSVTGSLVVVISTGVSWQLSFFWPSLIFIDHADQSEASICADRPIRSLHCQWQNTGFLLVSLDIKE
jgi:hypothetical protein